MKPNPPSYLINKYKPSCPQIWHVSSSLPFFAFWVLISAKEPILSSQRVVKIAPGAVVCPQIYLMDLLKGACPKIAVPCSHYKNWECDHCFFSSPPFFLLAFSTFPYCWKFISISTVFLKRSAIVIKFPQNFKRCSCVSDAPEVPLYQWEGPLLSELLLPWAYPCKWCLLSGEPETTKENKWLCWKKDLYSLKTSVKWRA